jgi:microcystin-dependent protein
MPLKIGKTTELVQSILVGSVIPPGTIAPFGGGTIPQGWLLCDGSTVDRTLYPALFEAVGTVHGQGDGTTTFHLPDYRGRFLRGADNMGTGAAGRDPNAATRTAANAGGATGAEVGSVQGHAFQTHTHTQNSHRHHSSGAGANSENARYGNQTGLSRKSIYFDFPNDITSSTNATRTSTETATNQNASASGTTAEASTEESRPQNSNVIWCIKV